MTVADVLDDVRSFRFEADQWLWCLHCERFFQGRDARRDRLGGEQGCAFTECDGAGYCVDIFDWDQWPMGDAEAMLRWPSERDLRHGLVARAWCDDERETMRAIAHDDLAATAMGIGRALNRDAARRDEILGIYTRADIDDVTPFRELELARLELLLDERFIPRGEVFHRTPAAETIRDFMVRFPEVRADGYAVHPDRPDYRVTIDTVRCELDTVDPSRRAELTEAFRAAFGKGSEVITNDELLFAWWD